MGRKKDVLDRLAERLARGEISEKTFLEIKGRYEKEGFPDEEPEEPREREYVIDVGKIIRGAMAAIPPIPAVAGMHGRHAVHASVHVTSGDYRGDEYRVTGVGSVNGNLAARKVDVVGVCRVGGDCVTDEYQGAGTCKVEGNLSAKECVSAGILKVEGDVVADRLTNSGMAKVEGNASAKGEFTNSGVLKVAGDALAQKLANSGAFKVAGDVNSQTEIVHSGFLKAGGDVLAQDFRSSGAFIIGGVLRANRMVIELSDDSRADTLEGGEIRVTSRGRGVLECDTVRGHTIYLEATVCDRVEGDDVEIGPRCRVEEVVARRLKVHETAHVGKKQVSGEA